MHNGHRNCLLIEDSAADQRLIQELLTELSTPTRCVKAESLSRAMELIEQDESFDAVLSDLGLPDSEGLDTVRSLLGVLRRVPLIVLTGLEDDELARQAVHVGAQDYISKNRLDATMLDRCIAYAIERKRAEQSVIQSVEDIGRKNEALEQFVYTVTHDLKTPLATQRGYIKLMYDMLQSGDADQAMHAAERIDMSNRRMRETIESLLEQTRSGLQDIEAQLIDMVALIYQVLDELRLQISEAGVKINVDDQMPAIFADKQRVRQIVENLVLNALQHGSTSTEPIIELGSEPADEEVRFYVCDNGPGIAAEHHEDMFRLFHRMTSNPDGSGIGLTVVRRGAESLGGRAWVESTPGRGATFWFSLPADKVVRSGIREAS